jgi:LuxR family maltose regulon positive regulatory protein
LIELTTSDLRFTSHETTAFLNETMGLTLTEEDIAELNNLTGGWIAGLQLAALSLQKEDDPAAISSFIKDFNGNHHYVARYLTEEVLIHLPDHIQRFLLTTSILERLNPSLCNAVTEQNDGEAVLEWLDQTGLFLSPEDHQHCWYHYDYLFSHHLRHH